MYLAVPGIHASQPAPPRLDDALKRCEVAKARNMEPWIVGINRDKMDRSHPTCLWRQGWPRKCRKKVILPPLSVRRLIASSRTSHPRVSYQVGTAFLSPVFLLTASSIRNRLTALKKDRGEPIKPSDVNVLYQSVVKQGIRA
jgi:hypothetical protein